MNRLGTLLAGLFALGLAVAFGVTLGVWLPQTWGAEPLFYEQGAQYLPFVSANPVSWQIFHTAANLSLLAALPLISLLSQHVPSDTRPAGQTIGLVGTAAFLLASLMDQFMTPVLARWAVGHIEVAFRLWETIEPFRDNGLKTIAFLCLGIWFLWVAAVYERPYRWLTQGTGAAVLLLGLVELLIPQPWKNIWGETGFLGMSLLLFPIWGLATAHWFWQKELKASQLVR